MAEVSSPRARLVELLWQLKQTYDKHGDGGVRYVHFSTLLKDSQYRRELIDQAAISGNAEIRELGKRLRQLNVDGELTHTSSAGDAGLPFNPDIAETITAGRPGNADNATDKRQRSMLGLVAAAAVACLAAGLVFIFGGGTSSNVESVAGPLYGKHHWTADRIWQLDGVVYVEAGGLLTIDAGTVVQGAAGSALVVTRDARIEARGNARAPVVFTSANAPGERHAGDWGGLVLLGAAPVNNRYAQIEGVPADDSRGAFGGGRAEDSCGVLEFARIEYAGFEVYANNELNGLTLGGCGSNTILRNVQVHRSLDDGVEIFGGSVDLKNVIITGAGDDSLDWDMGWQGRVQHLLVVQYPDVGDNAIEADNLDSDHLAKPRSEPLLYNVSLLSMRSGEKFQRGMTLRRGTAGHFHNVLISGFSGEAIDIKDSATSANASDGSLSFSGLAISNVGPGGNTFFADEAGAQNDDNGLDELSYFRSRGELFAQPLWQGNPVDYTVAALQLPVDSPAGHGAVAIPEGEFWDEAATYRGAVRPGTQPQWFDGWTRFDPN
ncbi:hypothetical protein NCG89_08680 [Spongiibacter taiwanensis]|uniref:hypothetical protein n=1 Tax=Spongiibacter taiwanensis TaxID=1748242 RepID=UPI00203588A3|nr:hypothetical protein [Spongiibacter taiwanensis]USA41595.1 hypothetical protein NCG89_08680 [Spongiibacter taiwanensis]